MKYKTDRQVDSELARSAKVEIDLREYVEAQDNVSIQLVLRCLVIKQYKYWK